ncbi:MAG: hypothetical protein R3D82_19505 [Xanthobacteraceae bacterium]
MNEKKENMREQKSHFIRGAMMLIRNGRRDDANPIANSIDFECAGRYSTVAIRLIAISRDPRNHA